MEYASNLPWLAFAIALIALLPLAWYSWKAGVPSRGPLRSLAFLFRFLGILFVAFAIADPQIVNERPVQGANIVALLADNSKGLALTEPGSEASRGAALRDQLTLPSLPWSGRLQDDFQVRRYRFDAQTRRIPGFESLDFSGEQSAIGHALTGLAGRLENKPVAGIVLFTDGNSTDPELTPEALQGLPPIYPVLVGSDEDVVDLSLHELAARASAFGDTPVSVSASIRQSRLPDGALRVQLRRIDADGAANALPSGVIDERSIPAGDDITYTHEWKSPGGGVQFFELSTRFENGDLAEATLDNNQQLFSVDRGKENYRILYVTGRPNWEYKFANRALSEDPQLDLVGLLRVASQEPKFEFRSRAGENSNALYRGFGREDETERYDEAVLIRMNARDADELKTGFPSQPEALFAYDAIVIDDLEADFFTFTQQTLIRDFVKQRGGGLLVLGGVNALEDGGYQNTPIAQVLPVYLDGASPTPPSDQSVRWSLTRNGWVEPWVRIRPFETAESKRIQEMPSFRVFNTPSRIKPGAQSLATIEGPSTQSYPALVTNRFGMGRVATLTVGDLWRWGMQSPGAQADLAQFWRQVSRWLVKDNPSRVELRASDIARDTVTLNAIARQADFKVLPAGNATLTVRRVAQDPSDRVYQMDYVPNVQGHFRSEIALKEAGAYTARVSVTNYEGAVLGEAETGWVYQPLARELASLSPNRTYLEFLAEESGGELLRLADLDRLPDILSARSSPLMESWSEPLWHRNWLFLLALGSFLAEWLLRRKRGLA